MTDRKSPEVHPEPQQETSGTESGSWLKAPDVADLLGISERAARDWVKRYEIPERGERPTLFSEAAIIAELRKQGKEPRKFPEEVPDASGSSSRRDSTAPEAPGTSSGSHDMIDAAYRVTPEEIEQAIVRTGDKYVADLDAMAERFERLYREQIQAKDETILALRSERETFQGRITDLAQERDDLRQRTQAVESEREALRSRVSELEARNESVVEREDDTSSGQPQRAWWRFWER